MDIPVSFSLPRIVLSLAAFLWIVVLQHSNAVVVEAFAGGRAYSCIRPSCMIESYRSPFVCHEALTVRTNQLLHAANANGSDVDVTRSALLRLRCASSIKTKKSLLRRLKDYVTYPVTFLRHLFKGRRPADMDVNDDIVASNQSVTEAAVESSSIVQGYSVVGTATLASSGTPLAREDKPRAVATTIADRVKDDRWAVSARSIDLSGNWSILTTDGFMKAYDKYLLLLGQPFIVRSVALKIAGMTTEETKQTGGGRTLTIRSVNARGVWERTLTASGADGQNPTFAPMRSPILTIDKEKVEAEAWWANSGTVHQSWLRGVKKYGGGDFESRRFLEENGKVLVCESTFHPNDTSREAAMIRWRFIRLKDTRLDAN